MPKNLKHEMRTAIIKANAFGQSKQADRVNSNIDVHDKIYSRGSYSALLDVGDALSRFIKSEYGINRLDKVTGDMVQAYVDTKSPGWSDRTLGTYISAINKIGRLASNLKGVEPWEVSKPLEREKVAPKRTRAFSRDDFNAVKDELQSPRNINGLTACEVTSRIGTRIEETASILGRDVKLDERVVHISNGKNGRNRDIPIRNEDIGYFKELKQRVGDDEYLTGGVESKSLNKQLSRAVERCGLGDKYKEIGFHGLRKMYARERYNEEISKGATEGSKGTAWRTVCTELGHNTARADLFETYVGFKG